MDECHRKILVTDGKVTMYQHEQWLAISSAMAGFSEIKYEYNKRQLVYSCDKIKLYHYQPQVKKPFTTPVLVVFATVNRPEILDLFPNKSFIRGLLTQGLDVYLLDWGYPDNDDHQQSFNEYVTTYLHNCIHYITKHKKISKIDLLGVCQGGLLCLLYAALYSNIRKLILISTPIDFQTKDNLIQQYISRLDIDAVIKLFGNIPGAWLTQFFISLRPFELIGKKYLRFADNIANEELTRKFLRIEKWLHDAPDQTASSFQQFIKECYCENKLIKNQLVVNGKRIILNKIKLPILNVIAEEDEIIPPSASRALKKCIGREFYTEKSYHSGHIGIYVSDKVNQCLPKEIAKWIIGDSTTSKTRKKG